MNNLNTTLNKKLIVTEKEVLQKNPNAEIIMFDPEKGYEKLIKRINDFPIGNYKSIFKFIFY